MHPIQRLINRKSISQAEAARQIGVAPQRLNDVILGRFRFGRIRRRAVVAWSGGEITLADLDNWEADGKGRGSRSRTARD